MIMAIVLWILISPRFRRSRLVKSPITGAFWSFRTPVSLGSSVLVARTYRLHTWNGMGGTQERFMGKVEEISDHEAVAITRPAATEIGHRD